MTKTKKLTINDLDRSINNVARSVNDLAKATKKGFAKVDEKFAKVDEKFAKVDEKFAKVDEKFAKVDEGFDKLCVRQLITDDKITAVENKMATKDDIQKILNAVDGIAKKHDKFETKLITNQVAHDRMQDDINDVREHVGLKIKHPALRLKDA